MQSKAEEKHRQVECSLAELPPVTIKLVADPQSWQRWKGIVQWGYPVLVDRSRLGSWA